MVEKITVFYPEPKEFVVGEHRVVKIFADREKLNVSIFYDNGDELRIMGVPYQALYRKSDYDPDLLITAGLYEY